MKKNIFWIFVIIITLITAVSCSNDPSPESNSNSINNSSNNIPLVTEADIKGFWHSTPDFSQGMGTTYKFFGGGEVDIYYADGRMWRGSWEIQDGNILKLYIFYHSQDDSVKEDDDEYSYVIDYVAVDPTTKGPALTIGDKKIWKKNYFQDVIDGSAVYINDKYNFSAQEYQGRQVITKKNHSSVITEYDREILIFSDSELHDFRIGRIRMGDDGNYYFTEILFSQKVLMPTHYVKFITTFPGSSPQEAIGFTDHDGNAHFHVLSDDMSGRDGPTGCSYKVDSSGNDICK